MRKYPKSCPLALAALLTGLSWLTVQGQETTKPVQSSLRQWAEQDYMFGNWGGLRPDLSKRGVDFEFFYAGSIPDNLAGGLRRGGIYQGGLLMTLDLDSHKLLDYDGGTLHISGLWTHGQKPFSENFVGDLNKVNLLDFANAARLWEVWYEQKLWDGKLAFKVGELSVDRDFLVPECYTSLGQFTLINQTFFYPTLPYDLFDIPGLPPQGHGLPSTPLATPGARVRWQPAPPWYVQGAVYNGTPDRTYSGTRFNLSEQEGALAYFETGYHRNSQTNEPGLEGSYKLGGYYHTGDFVDVYEGVTSAFLAQAGLPSPGVRYHTGNYGAYLLAEQQLFLEHGKSDPARHRVCWGSRVSWARRRIVIWLNGRWMPAWSIGG